MCVIIFFNIIINYMQINAVTLWLSISLVKATTNSHNRTCDTWRQRRLLPRNIDIHQGTKL